MSENNVLTLMNEKSINGRYCYRNIRSMNVSIDIFLKFLPQMSAIFACSYFSYE